MKKLYAGNLPYEIDDQKLGELFDVYGDVYDAFVITDPKTNKSKGFGFVVMEDEKAAENAMKELNDSQVADRKIIVNEAREN